MGILSQSEIDLLMTVETTLEEAQTILKRNQTLLEVFEAGKNQRTFIGCPHCSCDCPHCAWTRATYSYHRCCCCEVTFGGVCLDDVNHWISYKSDQECTQHMGNTGGTDDDIDDDSRDMCLRFLKGHIEWAMLIIARGGIEGD